MQDYMVDKTKLAVKAFEKFMAQANCTIKHYHADNGVFAHKDFLTRSIGRTRRLPFAP
jgi:hypothetical protein